MSDFLLELFSEEIPARMQRQAAADLARLFTAALAEAGVRAEATESFVTPRRLALIAHGLPLATDAVSEERRGPRADAPAQAVEGFLKSTGLTRDQLEERDDPKGRFLYAVIEKPGQATADVLARIVPTIIRDFPWPKSMRWGRGTLRWVRPLHSIVALLDGEIVPVEIDGIGAGRTTKGHRFLSSGVIEIGSAATYADQLRAAHVILSSEDRAALIKQRAEAAAGAAGLALIPDEGLLIENAGLTEWPVPLLGAFDPSFLDVPPEVIQLTMRVNQKYFACADPATGKLAPAFVCVANTEASDGGEAIVAGNRKVLAARLSDAKFFWEQDRKTTLESRLPKLADIVFHEKLGTVHDKVERVAKLARWLVKSGAIKSSPAGGGEPRSGGGGASEASPVPVSAPSTTSFAGGPPPPAGADLATLAETAARLCKADLVTAMVGEFPELQGIMGGYYARAEGLDPQIADAIRDHYKPVGQGDDVPTAPVTVAVSLADKLDTLVCFFAIKERPTGSKDPFALRRLMLGVINTIRVNRLRIPLLELAVRQRRQIAMGLRESFWVVDAADEFEFGSRRLMQDGDDWTTELKLFPLSASKYSVDDDPDEFIPHESYDQVKNPPFIFEDEGTFRDQFTEFLLDRLRVRFREAGIRHDIVTAVLPKNWQDKQSALLNSDLLAELDELGSDDVSVSRDRYVPSDDIVGLEAVAAELNRLIDTPQGKTAVELYKRAAKILVDAKIPTEFENSVERGAPEEMMALTRWVEEAEVQVAAIRAVPQLGSFVNVIASGKPVLDAFFGYVKVNDSDPAKRAARLSLLNRIRGLVDRIADFSKIEG